MTGVRQLPGMYALNEGGHMEAGTWFLGFVCFLGDDRGEETHTLTHLCIWTHAAHHASQGCCCCCAACCCCC